MIILADENVDRVVVARLRSDGHHVLAMTEIDPGIPDELVLAQANERGAVLLTEDKDFGELVYQRKLMHAGVVLVRLAGLPVAEKAHRLSATLFAYAEQITGAFCVLSRKTLRVRKR